MRLSSPLAGWLSVAMIAMAPCAKAEPVSQEYLGLPVQGNLEIAAGKSLAADGAVLIVHGTAAHHGLEVIAALQQALKQRNVNSLAITLSLGLQKRSGMLDCALEQDHRHADASDEIVAWVEWLQKKGASRVTVVGHSRGGAQAVLAAVERPDVGIRSLVLAAPLYQTEAEIATRYQEAFAAPLQPLLAKALKAVEAGEGDTLMQVPGFLHCKPAKVTAAAFHDYYAPDPQHDVLHLLGEVAIPVHVVLAGDDKVMPSLKTAFEHAKAAKSLPANVEGTTVDGADHFFRDLFGDDLADQVAAFVTRP